MIALSRTLTTALCAALLPCATSHAPATCGERRASRRHWLQTAAFGAGLGAAVPARALDALPATVRKYTALAPLGSATASVGGAKPLDWRSEAALRHSPLSICAEGARGPARLS